LLVFFLLKLIKKKYELNKKQIKYPTKIATIANVFIRQYHKNVILTLKTLFFKLFGIAMLIYIYFKESFICQPLE